MRTLILSSLLAAGFWISSAAADSVPAASGQVNQPVLSVEMMKTALTMDRRAFFKKSMSSVLTISQSETFWGIYQKYEAEKSKLMDEQTKLITDYSNNFIVLTDQQAGEVIARSYKNQQADIKIRKKFAAEISKKIGSKAGARFYQIDDYLSSVVKVGVMNHLPLIGDALTP